MFKITSSFLKSHSFNLLLKSSFCDKVPDKVLSYTSSIMFNQAVFNLHEASKDQVQEFLNSFDTVLTDCDGVLWIDNNVLPGSADAMNYFRKLGKKIFYVTNNSTKIRSDFASKAQQMGFIASQDEILSTAYLAAHYLKGIGFTKKVYLLGSNGIGEELKAVGIRHIGIGPDPVKPDYRAMKESDLDPEVGAVIVGFDEHVSYPKFMKAASYLASKDCLFIATNTDERYPRPGPVIEPGCGTFVKAVETCSGRQALVLGKPNDYVKKYLETYGLNPARTLMIGDKCSTDIEFGVRCGFQTLLVLSGVTSSKELEKLRRENTPPLPDVVLSKLGDLLSIPDPVKPDYKAMNPSDLDPEVGAVVVGFDEHVSYPKFMKAASYLASEECLFVATNTDERFPRGGSIVVPGTGTLVRAVETCSDRKAFVVGKPHDYVRKYLESCNLNPARTLMIGDRCNTDIELGVRCGFQTLLVLSGVTSNKDLEKLRSERTPPLPDVVLPKLGDLLSIVSPTNGSL